MKPTYKDLMARIFSVINYRDKEQLAAEIEEKAQIEALSNCIEQLPDSLQEALQAKRIEATEIIKYIPQDVYVQELSTASAKLFIDFLQFMKPVLTNDQKKEIAEVVSSCYDPHFIVS